VKVKDAPGYFDLIKTPIDLSLIKSKTKRKEYSGVDSFMDDIILMR